MLLICFWLSFVLIYSRALYDLLTLIYVIFLFRRFPSKFIVVFGLLFLIRHQYYSEAKNSLFLRVPLNLLSFAILFSTADNSFSTVRETKNYLKNWRSMRQYIQIYSNIVWLYLYTNTVVDGSVILCVCSFAIETTFPLSNFKTKHIFGILMARVKFQKPFGALQLFW